MPNANIFNSTLSTTPAKTNSEFVNFISNSFVNNLGFTLVQSIEGTIARRILSYTYDATKVKGTVFLRVSCSSAGSLTYSIFDSWNTSTSSGTNESTEQNLSFSLESLDNNIVMTSYSHPEFKGVALSQDSSFCIVGIIRPVMIPTWWDENIGLYAFLIRRATSQATHLNLYTTTYNDTNRYNYVILYSDGMETKQIVTGKYTLLCGLLICSASNAILNSLRCGIIAKTSPDLAICANKLLAPRDPLVVTAGVKEYENITPDTYTVGLAIRKV